MTAHTDRACQLPTSRTTATTSLRRGMLLPASVCLAHAPAVMGWSAALACTHRLRSADVLVGLGCTYALEPRRVRPMLLACERCPHSPQPPALHPHADVGGRLVPQQRVHQRADQPPRAATVVGWQVLRLFSTGQSNTYQLTRRHQQAHGPFTKAHVLSYPSSKRTSPGPAPSLFACACNKLVVLVVLVMLRLTAACHGVADLADLYACNGNALIRSINAAQIASALVCSWGKSATIHVNRTPAAHETLVT
jgi:hypothetical protein